MRLKTLMPRLHQAKPRGWQPDSHRGSRHERGYGWAWEKLVEFIKRRANGMCEPHAAMGLVHEGKQCDHILPKAQGGTDDEFNVHYVCDAFHAAKTAIESRGGTASIEEVAKATA